MEKQMTKERLQPTLKGIQTYLQSGQKDRTLEQKKVVRQLNCIIILHPLNYIAPYPDFEREFEFDGAWLVERGLAKEVRDNWRHLQNLVRRFDSDMLPVFRTYKALAHCESVTDGELTWALLTLQARAKEHDPWHAEKIDAAIGVIKNKSRGEKIAVLDSVMQLIHWDPDLLRHLSDEVQPLLSTAIRRWLDQLAGKSGDEVSPVWIT